MLLVPSSSPPALAPRYAAWPDGTGVAISSNHFSTPFGGWMFTSPNLLLEIAHVLREEEGGAVFAIFKRLGGVFTSPRLHPSEVLFVDSLMEGQLHGQGGVFSPNSGPASTCLDVLGSLVAAGDAWGRVAMWDTTAQPSPPAAVFGAHGKLGCSALKLFSGRRMVTVGGERNEIKLWDLASLRCVRAVDTGLAITTQPCLFHEGGGTMVAAAGTSCGRLVFWGDATPQLLSSEIACVVEYKGLVCACAGDGEFALWGAGKLVNKGRLPQPFCGLAGTGLVWAANTGDAVSVQDLVRWRPKPVTTVAAPRSEPKRAKQADASLPPFAQDKRRSASRSFYLAHDKHRFFVHADEQH